MHLIFLVDFGNVGTLLSGISSIILAILGIITVSYGQNLFIRWKREKRIQKLSDIAEEALNVLDSFNEEILNWLKYVDSWIVYDKNSETNEKKYDSLSFEKQKHLDDDKYEIHNFVKKGNEIFKLLIKVKYRVFRLGNAALNNYVNEFYDDIKDLPNDALHFKTIDKYGDQQVKGLSSNKVKNAPDKVCNFYDFLQNELLTYLKYEIKV